MIASEFLIRRYGELFRVIKKRNGLYELMHGRFFSRRVAEIAIDLYKEMYERGGTPNKVK